MALLGEGSRGVVYEAWDPAGERRAIKVLKPELARNARFLEALDAATARLSRLSPAGVARVHGVGTLEGGSPYVVMECLDGERLDLWAYRCGPVSIDDVKELGARLCATLAPLHARAISHPSLTPEHVFVSDKRELKVIGFEMPAVAQFAPSTDLRAVGVVLYRLLTGREPREDTDPRRLRADCPRQLANLVQALLGDPAHRPQSAELVGRALISLPSVTGEIPAVAAEPDPVFHNTAEILAQAPPVAKTLPPPAEVPIAPEAPPRSWRALAALALVVGLALIAGMFWLRREPTSTPTPAPAPAAPKVVTAVVAPAAPKVEPTVEPLAALTTRQLQVRVADLTAQLKQRPSTTYSARVELRKLLRRSEAKPDLDERLLITQELEHWQHTYLP